MLQWNGRKPDLNAARPRVLIGTLGNLDATSAGLRDLVGLDGKRLSPGGLSHSGVAILPLIAP
jgi:hypothetical protein